VVVPAGLAAVNVYVVVAVGETVELPDALTAPTVGEIDVLDAPVTCQDSCVLEPTKIFVGLAVKVEITGFVVVAGGGGGGGGGVEPAVRL